LRQNRDTTTTPQQVRFVCSTVAFAMAYSAEDVPCDYKDVYYMRPRLQFAAVAHLAEETLIELTRDGGVFGDGWTNRKESMRQGFIDNCISKECFGLTVIPSFALEEVMEYKKTIFSTVWKVMNTCDDELRTVYLGAISRDFRHMLHRISEMHDTYKMDPREFGIDFRQAGPTYA
jgi:hypothetical protein